jgi:ATP-dependent Clp protease ATP-binding subunit ClpB
VLDDGRLTDGQGRTVDFRNTVIIMTSNIGSDVIQRFNDDSQYEAMKEQVMFEVGNQFKPEFINRVDESVVFHPLLAEQIQKIALIQVKALASRLNEREIRFSVSDEALGLISEAGFDPLFGARPLKRAIQQMIENPLANKILSNEFSAGDKITVTVENGELVFN